MQNLPNQVQPQSDLSQQKGYSPQGGYPPPSYPPVGGYPVTVGYPPPRGYLPPGGYAPPGPFPQPGGYSPPPPPPGGYPPYRGYNDPEEGMNNEDDTGFMFTDESIRKAFIKKVYFLLMIQLLVTFGCVCFFAYHLPTRLWIRQHLYLTWVAIAMLFVVIIAMACCEVVRRKWPLNIIFLLVFTIVESFVLGVITASFRSQEVLIALGITAGICLALTLFAFQTKWDFTASGGILLVALIVLIVFGIFVIIFPGKIMTLIYSSLGTLIFSIYLIYDTQLMMGGKHKYSISPEEYIFATLNLYLDIVQIFMNILLLGSAARN